MPSFCFVVFMTPSQYFPLSIFNVLKQLKTQKMLYFLNEIVVDFFRFVIQWWPKEKKGEGITHK